LRLFCLCNTLPETIMAWFTYDDGTAPHRSNTIPDRSRTSKYKLRVKTRRSALLLSYAPDWIITLLVGGLFFILGHIDGFKREFSLTDTSLQHTFAVHERISNTNLGIIAVVAPLILMPLINLMTVRSFWDWHNSWLGVICATAFAGTATNIVKVTVGRPRPDVINRCQPLPGSHDAAVFGLVNATICTQLDEAIMRDGWKSFFSGHSSLSFAGLGFLTFYLAGKLHLFDKRGHAGKAWLSMIPLAGASLVAISRTMDNRHHWQDVLVGSLVGLAFAFFAYRQYYPALSDRKSHLPFRPRIDHDLNIDHSLPLHHGGSTTGSTHGLHPVSPGGHYLDGRDSVDSPSHHAPSSETAGSAEEPDRTYQRVDPPIKAHTAAASTGHSGSGQNLVDV